jgi:hypothetical protein
MDGLVRAVVSRRNGKGKKIRGIEGAVGEKLAAMRFMVSQSVVVVDPGGGLSVMSVLRKGVVFL